MRIVHLSDIHFWQYEFHPLRLFSKRLIGMSSLLLGRARRFRLERVPELVEYVRSLAPDHLLITGDLTTTALPAEFRAARAALKDLLDEPARVTIVPGNHDRYTLRAHRSRRFEEYLGDFSPGRSYPWLRMLEEGTAILGLDPTRPDISARGKLPRAQLIRAQEVMANAEGVARLLIACHYPVAAPPEHQREYARKPLVNAGEVGQWLSTIGPHLFCCGHVHAAWAFQPESIPNQLCLNPGAPLLRERAGHRLPGFLEILLETGDVTVHHHAWTGESWRVRLLHFARDFFPPPLGAENGRSPT
ncbi:MAG: metallophosphoesterase family protein [Isosphaerales bacterium]